MFVRAVSRPADLRSMSLNKGFEQPGISQRAAVYDRNRRLEGGSVPNDVTFIAQEKSSHIGSAKHRRNPMTVNLWLHIHQLKRIC
jgi:hypothetical protein